MCLKSRETINNDQNQWRPRATRVHTWCCHLHLRSSSSSSSRQTRCAHHVIQLSLGLKKCYCCWLVRSSTSSMCLSTQHISHCILTRRQMKCKNICDSLKIISTTDHRSSNTNLISDDKLFLRLRMRHTMHLESIESGERFAARLHWTDIGSFTWLKKKEK